MDALLQAGLSNALMATVLAVLAAGIGRVCQRPALAHGLWLLVLVKLITPSFVACSIPWPDEPEPAAVGATAIPQQAEVASASRAPVKSDQQAETEPNEDAANITRLSVPVPLPSADPSLPQLLEPQPTMDEPEAAASVRLDRSDPTPARGSAITLFPVIVGLWLAGSVTWFTWIAHRIYRFHRLLRCARPASPELCEQAQRLAARLGLSACPALWLVPGRLSPMVWALTGRPRLFVPCALWERLNQEQQAALLVHELAHLRRRDQWVRGLEILVTGLYWWHPVVWWACREIREAEEQCCDAWVVWALPRAARAYATALVETVDFLSETQTALPAVASGIGHVHDLRRRLTMIMHGTTPRALSGAGLLVVLGLGAFLLPLRPTWAQAVPREEPRERRGDRGADEQRQRANEAREQAERARQEAVEQLQAQRERANAEVENLAVEVQRMKAQLEEAMIRLQQAQARVQKLQIDAERRLRAEVEERYRLENVPRRLHAPDLSALPPRGGIAPDAEGRLTELEKKLDALLAEVQSMRREMRRSGPGMVPGTPYGPAGARPGEGRRPTREGEERGPSTPRPAGTPAKPPQPPREPVPSTRSVAPAPALPAAPPTLPAPPRAAAPPDGVPQPPPPPPERPPVEP